MATLNIPQYKTHGQLDAGYKSLVRVLDFNIDLSKDVTMGTATDDINLALLPAGAIVLAATVQQVVPGTGTGTFVVRVGTTAISGTLAATDPAGTVATTVPAAIGLTVPLARSNLNLLGATAARTTGKVRVAVTIVEGDRSPRAPELVNRDAIGA